MEQNKINNINEILKVYKDRLVNLSSRNRTICSNKIYKKNGIDLTILEKMSPNINLEILSFLLKRSGKSVLLVEDFNSVKLVKGDNYIDKHETKELCLREKQVDNMNISKGLAAIWSNVDEIEKEKGIYEMYLGFPFIEGQFKDGTPCRAPLFLFPVALKKESKGWVLSNILSDNIRLNPNFFLAFKNINNPHFEAPADTEIEKLEDISEFSNFNSSDVTSILEDITLYLESIGLEIENETQYSSPTKFLDYKKSDYAKYKGKKMALIPYLILGQFPLASSSLYNEYSDMIENGVTDLIENLLKLDTHHVEEGEFINDDKEKLCEKDIISITELDYSQEKAVKKSIGDGNIVVYGPPGTGKSQVISNIIANYMWMGKKVLLVSEKRTALDVVYKRLEKFGLSNQVAIVHDSQKDRNDFYHKITDIINKSAESSNELAPNTEHSDNISQSIDEKINELDILATELKKNRCCGYSLRELYGISKLDQESIFTEFDANRFPEFDKLTLDNLEKKLEIIMPFIRYDYNENTLSHRLDFSNLEITKKFEIHNHLETIINYHKSSGNSLINDNILTLINALKNEVVTLNDTCILNKTGSLDSLTRSMEELLHNIAMTENDKHLEYKSQIIKKVNRNKLIYTDKKERVANYKNEILLLEKLPTQTAFDNTYDITTTLEEIKNCFFISLKKLKLKKYLKSKYGVEYSDTCNNYYKKLHSIKEKYMEILIENQGLVNDFSQEKTVYLRTIIEHEEKYIDKIETLVTFEESLDKIGTNLNLTALSDFLNKSNEIKIDSTYEEYTLLLERVSYLLQLNEKWDYLKNNFNYEPALRFITDNSFDKNDFFDKLKNESDYLNFLSGVIKRIEFILSNLEIKTVTIDKIEFNLIPEMREIISELCCIFSEYNKENNELTRNLDNNISALESVITSLSNLENYFKPGFLNEIIHSFNDVTHKKTCELQSTLHLEFEQIKNHDFNKLKLSESENIIYDFLRKINNNNNNNILFSLKNTFFINWIEHIHREIGESISILERYNNIKIDIKKSMELKKSIVPEIILEKITQKILSNRKFNRLNNEINYREMLTSAQKKRNIPPLRQYIETYQDNGIFDLLPVWLLTPKVVSEILPFTKDYFDIVLFDEASQMFVENSLPSIYRGKKIVIAGDDKQLRPTSIGIKSINENDIDIEDSDDLVAIEEESLLDLAKARYDKTLLSYHYRAHYEELINFSNYAFYGGKLVTVPNKSRDINYKPIERIKVDGIWENKSNMCEAEAVYNLLFETLTTRTSDESIGIITFNAGQQEFIKEYLNEKSSNDPEFNKYYSLEINRVVDGEDKSLFIKNIENVQGDERDIIIFSTAYAKDNSGTMRHNFGSLNQKNGENRLNVAISRAKKKIYVVTSIEPEDLRVENSTNDGPKLLKKYLQYARAISNGNSEEARSILNSFVQKHQKNDTFDSPFEEEVCIKLRDMGYEVYTQVGDSGYRIDLAIYDKEKSAFVLGIECDGAMYHSSPSARERDIYRQAFLENKGWNIHRIWSYSWWNNPTRELEKVKDIVDGLLGK